MSYNQALSEVLILGWDGIVEGSIPPRPWHIIFRLLDQELVRSGIRSGQDKEPFKIQSRRYEEDKASKTKTTANSLVKAHWSVTRIPTSRDRVKNACHHSSRMAKRKGAQRPACSMSCLFIRSHLLASNSYRSLQQVWNKRHL